MSNNRTVLLLGLDPHAVPGVDAAMVEMAIAIGQKRFDAEGIPVDTCLVKPDDSAEPAIVAQLARKDYACVVIGGGIRKPDEMIALLEKAIHRGPDRSDVARPSTYDHD